MVSTSRFRNFEHQFVMHLQCHARLQFLFAQIGVETDHGDLNQVGGGALQRRVHGRALGEAAQVRVALLMSGIGRMRPNSVRHLLFARELLQRAIDKRAYPAVLLEVALR